MDLSIKCKIYNARLTESGCRANQKWAIQAVRKLSGENPQVSALSEIELDRLAGCGQCSRCKGAQGGDIPRIYVEALTRDITILCDKILVEHRSFDWEEQQKKRLEKYKRYDKKRRKRPCSK